MIKVDTERPPITARARAASSLTGMNAPLMPPMLLEANAPPFFTASLSMATIAVDPGAPMASTPRILRISRMGTMRSPTPLSRSRFRRSLAKAIVVETSWPPEPFLNSP